MVATIGKGTEVDYYLGLTEYHLSGREPDGTWLSAPPEFRLDVGGVVDRASFTFLNSGCSPDGKQLFSSVPKRVANFDMTLSAPKSVSLAFALSSESGRARIEQAQSAAAEAVVAFLNREAAFVRRGRGGEIIHKATLTIAAFQHAESRPALHSDGRTFADPDLHTHLSIANLGRATHETSTGKAAVFFGALDARALYAAKMGAGAVYHQTLATGLQALGYQIEKIGKNGIFEIADARGQSIPDTIKRYFSARRNLIEKRLSEYETLSGDAPALAAAITRGTRSAKLDKTEDRFARWKVISLELGFEGEAFGSELQRANVLNPSQQEALVTDRLLAIADALTEHESVFERRRLVAAVATALVGSGAEPGRVNEEVEKLISGQKLILLGYDRYGHGFYSTPTMVAIERSLVDMATKLARTKWVAVPPKEMELTCARLELSPEQIAAAKSATGRGALAIVEGAAGAGKTTTLRAVTEAYRRKGKRVLATAIAWRTAHLLRDELGVEAFALDSLLARCESGKIALDRDTVLLVDEAGQIGSWVMHALVKLVCEHGGKIIVVGDRNQLQSIAAGPAMQIMARSMEPVRIETVMRQRDVFARDAAAAVSKGNAAHALATYKKRGLVTTARGGRSTIVSAVDAWFDAQARSPVARHLLIAKSNSAVRALNVEIRKRWRDSGHIRGDEFIIPAGDASGKSYRLGLALGDRIRFGIRMDTIGDGVINGTTGVIEQIDHQQNGHLRITAQIEGERRVFSTGELCDEHGRVRLSHDLATTVYSSQGLTAETATVLLDANFDRHDGYVALSRARGETRIVIDEMLLDAQIMAGRDHDRRGVAVEDQERMAFLGARLGRTNVKTSTLDRSGMFESAPTELGRSSDKRRAVGFEL